MCPYALGGETVDVACWVPGHPDRRPLLKCETRPAATHIAPVLPAFRRLRRPRAIAALGNGSYRAPGSANRGGDAGAGRDRCVWRRWSMPMALGVVASRFMAAWESTTCSGSASPRANSHRHVLRSDPLPDFDPHLDGAIEGALLRSPEPAC